MSAAIPPAAETATRGLAGVLHIPAFRRLWIALSLSSLGDWLGLLAVTAMAAALSSGSYAQANIAVAGVFILRLAPAVVLGPLAGAVADRLDRRWTMVACDVTRFCLVLSIPIVGSLWWLYAATFLIECAALFWIPSKEATVPNLVPRERLEQANQVSLFATYGAAPVAAGLFALLTVVGGPLSRIDVDAVDVALVFDALTFLVAALVVSRLRAIPPRQASTTIGSSPSVWHTIVEGWRFVGSTPLVRGLVVGMLGAFAAGGAVVGLARTFVAALGAGDPGYGVLFAAVFLGLAAGMGLGPRLLHDFSRRRLFGLAIAAAGVSLALLALVGDVVLATLVTFVLGGFAGVAWVSGYTLLGLEVADELRGRTFAFVQTMVRIVLVAVLAIAPLLAAAIGEHSFRVGDDVALTYHGSAIVFFLAGLLAAALGVASYRQMDDRRGVSLRADLVTALRGRPLDQTRGMEGGGLFLALEGGEGAGKSTQADRLAQWLTERGHEVVLTREPGGTQIGARLRDILLDPANAGLSERAETLLYAADRADHVEALIRPALRRGAVVITDRYVDSSVAYQGAGRVLPADQIARISRWATGGLVPGLTVLLDIAVPAGLSRVKGARDRLESEPPEFHERVRRSFLDLAEANPQRYLVLDAGAPADVVAEQIRQRVEPLLPVSARELAAEQCQRREQEAQRRAEAEREAEREAEQGRRAELARQARVAAARTQIEAQQRAHAEEVAREDAERAAAERAEQAERAERTRVAAEERSRRRAAAESARRIAAEQRRQDEIDGRARRAAEQRAHKAEQRRRQRQAEQVRVAAHERGRREADERSRRDADGRSRRQEAEQRRQEAELRRRETGERSRDADSRRREAELRRRDAEERRLDAEERRLDAYRRPRGAAATAAPDPATEEFSLTDDLFSFSEDDTIEIPRWEDR